MVPPVVLTTESTHNIKEQNGHQRLHIDIHIQADVVPAKEAIQRASTWLMMNAGNLLRADNPELIVSESLQWRLDVWLAVPALNPPRVGLTGRIGQIYVDAETGEVLAEDSLVDKLKAAADAFTAN